MSAFASGEIHQTSTPRRQDMHVLGSWRFAMALWHLPVGALRTSVRPLAEQVEHIVSASRG
jgi:hypothetical protein